MGNVIISTYGLTFSRHGKLIHCKQHCRWPKGRHTTDHLDWFLPRPTATFTLDRELSTSIFSRYLCKSPWMILTDNFCWFQQNVRMQGLDKVIPIYRSSFPESNNSVGVLEGRIFCTLCNCAENTFPLACWILWTLLCMQKKSSWIE